MERERELTLVRGLRAGDTSAFDEIYASFNHRLLRFLTRMARNRSLAEDLVEETWLRLVAGCANLDADTRLAPWLFTVARNLYLSHFRSTARENSGTADLILRWPGEPQQSPFDAASLNELEGRLEAALTSLPPSYREALLLVGVEQLRPVDAARVCGISADLFRQRLSRARRVVLRFLNNDNSNTEADSEAEKDLTHDTRG